MGTKENSCSEKDCEDVQPDSKNEKKEVAYYSAGLNAWYTTLFELDKSLLTLSSAGIALLMTIVNMKGVTSKTHMVLYILALFFFSACLLLVLFIYKRNAIYLEKVLSDEINESDPTLTWLDILAPVTFAIGAILSAVIGISAVMDSYTSNIIQ